MAKPTGIKNHEKDVLNDFIENKLPLKIISDKWHTAVPTMTKFLISQNLNPLANSGRVVFTTQNKEKVLKDFRKGLSVTALSKIYKVPRKQIDDFIKSKGFNLFEFRDFSNKKRVLTEIEKQQIINDYTLSLSITKISKKRNIFRKFVAEFIREEGLYNDRITLQYKLTEEQECSIVESYKNNIKTTLEKLAIKFKVSTGCIRDILVRYNITIRSKGEKYYHHKSPEKYSKEILDMWKKKKSIKEISTQLNIFQHRVAAFLVEHTIKSNRLGREIDYILENCIIGLSYSAEREYLQTINNYRNCSGICDICGQEKTVVIEHYHSKGDGKIGKKGLGLVRGLACNICNYVVGYFEGREELSKNMNAYIKKYNRGELKCL